MKTVAASIIVADAGPLIRLAAAGLLDAIRLTNRQVVMVDRIEEVRGYNPDAARALEGIKDAYNLKPASVTRIDPPFVADHV